MSSAFHRVPRYSNDTDDENSIHLKQMIGKSNPLRSPRKPFDFDGYRKTNEPDYQPDRQNGATEVDIDAEISMTLNGVQEDVDEDELNESYLKFINNQYDNDYNEDEDEDYVLSDGETYNGSLTDDEGEDWEYLDYKRNIRESPEYTQQIESPRLRKTIDFNESNDSDLTGESKSSHGSNTIRWKSYLGFAVAYVTVLFIALIIMLNGKPQATPNSKIDLRGMSTRIDDFDHSLLELQRQTETKLESINSKVESLYNKAKPIEDTEKLIYTKHGQVQVSPQFHQFLNSFLDSYSESHIDDKLKELQPEKRLQNVDELKQYVDQAISNSIDSITLKVEENVDKILDGLNIVNDTITTDPRLKNPSSKNKVWINSMLEFISKGSKLVNYADYNQGSRILGFLTSNLEKYNLFKKMWYGWIMFAEGLQDRNNAIHVLLDNDITWKGGDEIGIRLSRSIIPTDVLIQLEDESKENPVRVSIGFKPYSKAGFDALKFPKVEDSAGYNINACKFKFIKSSHIRSGINHIKMPVRFVNHQIAGKDIYFKFSRDVKITNIKVYGISDVNAVRLQDRFKLLVDEFNVDESVDGLGEEHNKGNPQSGHDREEMKVYDINDDIYL
ncbi:hypothetical protein I9W82_003425 [Candida metapsilosis]|uniref:SUN domain-containing protein n=1 Tax=Candida metapsilosis TaxID=273372 RepID=A0A8H7ZBB9_9ASCO|nr:hypothetical protein I9W82_003425 [Candida metapsilosis]